ncbi:MAG: substrate-binding domain-containing protein [Desulfatibacillaceae bacterium]
MKTNMKVLSLCFVLVLCMCAPGAGADKVIEMATTTSTQASGLLDELLPEFEKDTGISMKVIAKGTGAALRDGMEGNVDVLFVHARGREEKFVLDGYGTARYAVMHNDFVILGPKSDPAGIKGMTNVSAVLAKIASSGSGFVSRGDDSGTHTKEQALWKASGVPVEASTQKIVKKGREAEITFVHPRGMAEWYHSIGQGMGKAIVFAEEKRAYVMSDRGTYIKYKFGSDQGLDLEVLCEGDSLLYNPYGVIPVNPEKFPHVKADLAEQFARWLISRRGQGLIGAYRLEGRQLFYPDVITVQAP